MKKTIVLLSILGLIWTSCQKEENTPKEQPVIDPVLKSAVVERNNTFSLDIFKQLVTNDPSGDNVFISPLSMYYALNMAGVGSDANTRTEFGNLLGWEETNDSAVLVTMKQLYSELMPTDNQITLEIANSLWQRQDFPIYDDYKTKISTWFDGEVSTQDFNDPKTVTLINNWIAAKTHDKITNMLTEISPNAVLFLINAIYFKGDWKYKFDKQYTVDGNFTKENGETMTAKFMNAKPTIRYLVNDYCTMVSLPYADSAYTMVLLLPKSNSDINSLLEQLNTETFIGWQNQMAYTDVDVSLPKFKFTYGNREISPELKTLGLLDAFDSYHANFSKISPEQIFISMVLHKAFIEVNEEGSEAAAATIIGFENTSIGPEKPTFIANRPFLFAICHRPTNTILFVGKVAYPE